MTHTHIVLARLATVGMVSTAFLIMASQSNGQTPRYRLTPLVKLGFTPQADLHGTLGINNKGQVVYGYVEPTSGDERAWLWLPETDYGFTTAGGGSSPTLEEAIAIVMGANIPEATKAEIISELVNNWN